MFYFVNQDLRPFDIHEGILGLIVNVLTLVVVSLLTQPQDPGHVAAYVEAAATAQEPAADTLETQVA